MTPYVLIIVMHIGYGAAALQIDMPNRAVCEQAKADYLTAVEKEGRWMDSEKGFCLLRQLREPPQ